MWGSVVRFRNAIKNAFLRITNVHRNDNSIHNLLIKTFHCPVLRYLAIITVLMIVSASVSAYAQKSLPLASQVPGIPEYENLVRSGLPLSHEDSVLVIFGQMKGWFRSLPPLKNPYGKCGSELAFEATRIQEKFSKPLREAVIRSIPSFSDSVISPSGRFTIYYDKSGANAASDEYVDSIKHFADEADELEIAELGYPKPPFTSSDSTWHIFLVDQGSSGNYGSTTPITPSFGSSPSGLTRYRSYITIDNDFLPSEYKTVGTDAARITVFHEFHHVIQNGSYGSGNADVSFREMTAVWMEMRSTPWVPDYLQYIDQYLEHLDTPFDHVPGNGYDQCIWLQFLQKKFDDDIIRNVWEFYSDKHANFLMSFDSLLTKQGTNFCSEYKRFGTEVYYAGRNFQGASVFPDARRFNQDAVKRIVLSPNVEKTFQAFPASVNILTCGYGKDTSVITISRSTDLIISDAYVTSKSLLTFQDSFQFPGIFCDTISLPVLIATKIFPQPFIISSPTDGATLSILASTETRTPTDVSLSIYAPDNTLIRHFDRTRAVLQQTLAADPFGGSWYVEWDGRDDTGRLAPSGVYYYSVKVDGNRDNGKFVFIRKN